MADGFLEITKLGKPNAITDFCHSDGLPFMNFLSLERFSEIFDSFSPTFRNRIFPPVITLSAFISQVLSSDHSCCDAVTRVIAERISEGQTACSEDNSPYCRARQLPEELLKELMKEAGATLDEQSNPQWLWKQRPVKLVDGTTVSIPDTLKNQVAYPQPDSQKKGLGFPIVRLVGLRHCSLSRQRNRRTCITAHDFG